MRTSRRLLASASNVGAQPSQPFRPTPMALLPPVPLYRRILRTHRKLPKEERMMGDLFVKKEFRDHKDTENPVHIIGFLSQWQLYAQTLEGNSWKGEKMDKAKIDKMSDQQLGQLHELMQAIRNRELGGDDPHQGPNSKSG